MLNKTVTLEQLIDHVLLMLWYAENYKKKKTLPEIVRNSQADLFRTEALGIISFISTEVLSPTQLINYKGINIPLNIIEDLIIPREKHFKHP